MRLTGIDSFYKYVINVDGQRIGEFYSRQAYTRAELDNIAYEYAVDRKISANGVTVHITRNDGKIGGESVMPHYGKVS